MNFIRTFVRIGIDQEIFVGKENKVIKMQQKINDEENILLELRQLEKEKKKAEKLQEEYDFSIPNYVLSEMQIGNENALALIGLARLNNRISKENANILKERLR